MFIHKMKFAILLLCCVNILSAYVKNENVQNPINKFSVEFYKETSKLISEKSLIMSPFSVEILLGLISAGSEGKTQKEIIDALHTNDTNIFKTAIMNKMTKSKNKNGFRLNIANKIYVKDGERYELSPVFKSTANESYFSDIENIDFSNNIKAVKNVNNWVENKTNGKIKELFSSDSFDSTTCVVLVNAIYFFGDWKYPFDKNLVSKKQFHVSRSETIMVDMMFQLDDFPYFDSSELDSHILGLPYKNSDSSLILMLPKRTNGLKALEEKIVDISSIDNILNKMISERVHIEIPKFKVEMSINLKDVLPKLGIELIFDQSKAELGRILKTNEKIYVSEALQKAFIEVNERGTEAGAGTGISTFLISGPRATIRANHPFLYFVKHDNDIIFFGKYLGK